MNNFPKCRNCFGCLFFSTASTFFKKKYTGHLKYRPFRISMWFSLPIWTDLSVSSWTFLNRLELLSKPCVGFTLWTLSLFLPHSILASSITFLWIKKKTGLIDFVLWVLVVAYLHACMYALCMPSVHGSCGTRMIDDCRMPRLFRGPLAQIIGKITKCSQPPRCLFRPLMWEGLLCLVSRKHLQD